MTLISVKSKQLVTGVDRCANITVVGWRSHGGAFSAKRNVILHIEGFKEGFLFARIPETDPEDSEWQTFDSVKRVKVVNNYIYFENKIVSRWFSFVLPFRMYIEDDPDNSNWEFLIMQTLDIPPPLPDYQQINSNICWYNRFLG